MQIRSRIWLVGNTAVALLVVGLLLLSAADSAAAARPAGGSLYATHGEAGFLLEMLVELRVSPNGRSLRPRGSVVKVDEQICNGISFHVGRRGDAVRVNRDGSFEFRIRDQRHIVFRGRFRSRETAVVRLRFHPTGRRLSLSCGNTVRFRALVTRAPAPTFTDCQTHPDESEVDTSAGRLFHVHRYIDHGWYTVVFGCLFSENVQVLLGKHSDTDDAGTGFKAFRMAGAFVAWSQFECFAFTCPYWWTILDLRGAGPAPSLEGAEKVYEASDLELKENGSFGYIVRNSGDPPTEEVWIQDALGTRKVDAGNIDPFSLTMTGSTLTWIKDGSQRSAEVE